MFNLNNVPKHSFFKKRLNWSTNTNTSQIGCPILLVLISDTIVCIGALRLALLIDLTAETLLVPESDVKKVHIEVMEVDTAAPPQPAGSDEEDEEEDEEEDDDDDDDEDEEEEEGEEEAVESDKEVEEVKQKEAAVAKRRTAKESVCESSDSEEDDGRNKEEQLYERAKRRIEVSEGRWFPRPCP